jgi:hypothetical protein
MSRSAKLAAACLGAAVLAAGIALPLAAQDSNLDYWLDRATTAPAETQPAEAASDDAQSRPSEPTSQPASPLRRADALPGAIQLSDGRVLTGYLSTTQQAMWLVFETESERWRMIPPAAVLSITAEVVEEKQELKWRWKAMGEPERVYTGERYPSRRLTWRFLLADGTEIVGAVKGQPISVTGPDAAVSGPFVFHERQKGQVGQSLDELVYIRRVVISRKVMEKAIGSRQQVSAAWQCHCASRDDAAIPSRRIFL